MTARGIRNNNPGNIVDGYFTQAIVGYTGSDGRFATYEKMENGIEALIQLLRVYRSKHNLVTVRGVIDRWAPPVENNTSAYVTAVCDGWVGPDDELPDTPETYLELARRIAKHENGNDWLEISNAQWEAGMRLAGLSGTVTASTTSIPTKQEKKVPGPFLGLAWEALLESIPVLIRNLGHGEQSEKNAQIAEVVVPLAKEVIGAKNEQELIEAVKNDPRAVEKIDRACTENWLTITEVGGGGIAGARAFAAEYAGKPRNVPLEVVSYGLLVIFGAVALAIVGAAIWRATVTADHVSMIVQAVIGGSLMVGGFWLGSSYTTSRSRGIGDGSK